MKHLAHLSAAALATASLATSILAQPPIDDAMWIAARFGRTLTKVSACGEVLQQVDLTGNGFDLRGVTRAPDGNLWVINFITPTMTILDRNGNLIKNVTTAGNAFAIVFDRGGLAYVSLGATVGRFDPLGNLLNTYTLSAANALGMTVDKSNRIWIAHRNTAGSVSMIDPATATVANFPITGLTLPVSILADYRGPAMKSHIWVIGDGSNQLVEMDENGAQLNVYTVGTFGGYLSGITLDREGKIWVSANATGGQEVHRFDPTTGTVIATAPNTPNPIGMSTDGYGRPWVVNRVGFSAPPPSENRRLNLKTGATEVVAQVGIGAYESRDAGGFQWAFVVDPTGDADGDGDSNEAEVLGGTSPYDSQSRLSGSILATGATQIGNTAQLQVSGSMVVPVTLAFASGRAAPLSVPGILGQLRLDVTKILPITLNVLTGSSFAVNIPNNPALIGFTLVVQGITPVPTLRFTNETCFQIW